MRSTNDPESPVFFARRRGDPGLAGLVRAWHGQRVSLNKAEAVRCSESGVQRIADRRGGPHRQSVANVRNLLIGSACMISNSRPRSIKTLVIELPLPLARTLRDVEHPVANAGGYSTDGQAARVVTRLIRLAVPCSILAI